MRGRNAVWPRETTPHGVERAGTDVAIHDAQRPQRQSEWQGSIRARCAMPIARLSAFARNRRRCSLTIRFHGRTGEIIEASGASARLPFHMPTRLADGLGFESGPGDSRTAVRPAPGHSGRWFPRIQRKPAGSRLRQQRSSLFSPCQTPRRCAAMRFGRDSCSVRAVQTENGSDKNENGS